MSRTASSTKVRITGYFTTPLSPNSFLRIVNFLAFCIWLDASQSEWFCFVYFFCTRPYEFSCMPVNTWVSSPTEWTRTTFPPFLYCLEIFSLQIRGKTLHIRNILSPAQTFALPLNAKEEELWSWALLTILNPEISIHYFIASWLEAQVCGWHSLQHLAFVSQNP